MSGWLKRFRGEQKSKTVVEVMATYGALIEKHPVAIMDVAMLPIPKAQMKLVLKALYAKATASEIQNHLAVSFMLLSQFQDGVGPTPIDGAIKLSVPPTQAEMKRLDEYMAWEKLSLAETEILSAEWKRYLAGEAI